MNQIPIEEMRSYFSYDPDTGEIKNKKYRSSRAKEGQISTWGKGRYLYIRFNGKFYVAHRVAWSLTNGEITGVIDHINGNGHDNRLCNLRECSVSENMRNQKNRKPNPLGFKGVTRDRNKFKASIRHQGRQIHLGNYLTAQEAHSAYCRAAIKLHGEFATLNYE